MKKNALVEVTEIMGDVIDYNNNLFKNTNFSGKDLDSFEFIDCTFLGCDFSMSTFSNTVLTRAKFKNCKLLGVDFSVCSKFAFSVRFEDCVMDYVLFHKNELKKTEFKDCQIKEANFFECNLNSAKFDNCNLSDSVFDQCNLSKADFRLASNYLINPSNNNIKKAKFSFVLMILRRWNGGGE